MDIRNATAIVTGANRGIGHELVRALLASGVGRVYAGARNVGSLASTLALDPRRVTAMAIDVTDPGAVAALPGQAGDVTLLINNAGVRDFGGILDVSLDVLGRNLATNFLGSLAMSRAFAPVIERNGGGGIVNLLSVVALASMPGLAAYNASKAAALSMTQSLRASLASRGIDVFSVFPGPVDTEMAAAIDIAKTSPADVARAIVAGVAEGREDIFPDPMSAQLYDAWKQDHKAVEKQFAAM